ncbi:hypothetical protein L7F22_004865 [Adiantum nelumboides]|nr:hypothetical protein [Adiantum nelumboides]
MVKRGAFLIVKQILGIWACKNERLREKVQAIHRLFNQFEEVQLYHILRKQNEVVDLLAQEAVACDESEVQVILAATAIKQPRYQGMESLAPIVSYILKGEFPQSFTKTQKRRLMEKASSYLFLEGALYQRGKDQVCRRIPTVEEISSILEGLHEEACGGHFAQELTAKKILLSGFGTPLEIVSDNGPGFRKGLLTKVCDELHILHRHSTPYYPQSNGLVEKANGIIAGIIQKMVKNKTKLWNDFLDGALWAYQTTYKEAKDFTPFHLVYGQEALQPIELNISTIRLHGKVAQGEEEAWADRLLTLAELEWKREAAYECYKSRATQIKDKLNKKFKNKGIKERDQGRRPSVKVEARVCLCGYLHHPAMADYWRYQDRLGAGQLLSKRPRSELDDALLQSTAGYGRGELRYDERDARLLDLGLDYGKTGAGYGSGVLADSGLTDATLFSANAPRVSSMAALDDLRLSAMDPGLLKGSGAGLHLGRGDLPRHDGPTARAGYRPLPADASPTLFVEGIPIECTRREVAHIFRPFRGFKEVRIVQKESKRSGGELFVLCFAEFEDSYSAAKALDSLQGYKLDDLDHGSEPLRLQFARVGGPRGGGRDDYRGGRDRSDYYHSRH